MAARSKARRRALDVLFEAEQRGTDPIALAAERIAGGTGEADGATTIPQYAVDLVEGVQEHRERIDELLSTYSMGWPLERMPAVDRNVLRIASYELIWCDDIPDPVAIDEAVDLVKALSTDDSPSFVNGLLGRLLQLKPTLVD